jgi:hypothetical protein
MVGGLGIGVANCESRRQGKLPNVSLSPFTKGKGEG